MANVHKQAGTQAIVVDNPILFECIVQEASLVETFETIEEMQGDGGTINHTLHNRGQELTLTVLAATDSTKLDLFTGGTKVVYSYDGDMANDYAYQMQPVTFPRTPGQFVKFEVVLKGFDCFQAAVLADPETVDSAGDPINP